MENKEKKLKDLEEEKNKQEDTMKKRLKELGIEEIIYADVKKFSKSAHVIIPKKYLNRKVAIFISSN